MIRKETFELISKECWWRLENGGCSAKKDNTIIECTYENCHCVKHANKNMENYPTDPEAFANVMLDIYKKYVIEEYDQEDVHRQMDNEIMNLLKALGYHEAAYIFEETDKWYS